jgi:CBS domain-containing protein
MKVQDMMTKNVSCCDPGTNSAVAAELMWTRNCGALPVVEEGGRVAGIVTDRDLFIALGTNNRNASDLPVGALMAKEPSTCAPGDDIRAALNKMAQHQVQRLPVVDAAGILKGIISIEDVSFWAAADGLSDEDVLAAIKAIWGRQIQRKADDVQPSSLELAAA